MNKNLGDMSPADLIEMFPDIKLAENRQIEEYGFGLPHPVFVVLALLAFYIAVIAKIFGT